MTKSGNNSKEDVVLKKTDSETGFMIRLHFMQDHEDGNVVEEIQRILTETYIRRLAMKGGE